MIARRIIPVYSTAACSSSEPNIAARVSIPCEPWEAPEPYLSDTDRRILEKRSKGRKPSQIASDLGVSKERVLRVIERGAQ